MYLLSLLFPSIPFQSTHSLFILIALMPSLLSIAKLFKKIDLMITSVLALLFSPKNSLAYTYTLLFLSMYRLVCAAVSVHCSPTYWATLPCIVVSFSFFPHPIQPNISNTTRKVINLLSLYFFFSIIIWSTLTFYLYKLLP